MNKEYNLELESFSELSIKNKYAFNKSDKVIFMSGDVCYDMLDDFIKNFNDPILIFRIRFNENQIIDEESINIILMFYYRIVSFSNNNNKSAELIIYGNISILSLIFMCSFNKRYIYENYNIIYDTTNLSEKIKNKINNILSISTKLGIEYWNNINKITFTSSEALEIGISTYNISCTLKNKIFENDEKLTKKYIEKNNKDTILKKE